MSENRISPLRQKMIREMQLQRLSEHTVKAYLASVEQLSKHYGRSPDHISRDEVREFIYYLIAVRKLAASTVDVRLAGIKFFYQQVVRQPDFNLRIRTKRSGRLPEPHSRSEVADLISAISNQKHRVMMMTSYSAGVRVSELVSLEVKDIHSQRMLIHVRSGKGNKDRFTLLSERLLAELRSYWLTLRPHGVTERPKPATNERLKTSHF